MDTHHRNTVEYSNHLFYVDLSAADITLRLFIPHLFLRTEQCIVRLCLS